MKILFTLSILFSTLVINAQSTLTGKWNIGQENTVIDIQNEEAVISAKIISSDNPKLKPGTLFLKNVELQKNEWKGKLYNIKKDKWYDVSLKSKDEVLEAKVKAGMMKKTLAWTRVK